MNPCKESSPCAKCIVFAMCKKRCDEAREYMVQTDRVNDDYIIKVFMRERQHKFELKEMKLRAAIGRLKKGKRRGFGIGGGR